MKQHISNNIHIHILLKFLIEMYTIVSKLTNMITPNVMIFHS
jgi:hypothetical protein